MEKADEQPYRSMLNAYNIRPTSIRIQILKVISVTTAEFTKAEITSEIRKENPSISGSSVTSTLILFKRTKLISEATNNTFQSLKKLGRSATKYIYTFNKFK